VGRDRPDVTLVAPFTVVRVERPYSWAWIDALPGLVSVDLRPPASGPEIELTFGTSPDADRPAELGHIRLAVEEASGKSVLAIAHRERQPIIKPGAEFMAAKDVLAAAIDDPAGFAAADLLHRAIDAVEAVRHKDDLPTPILDRPEA
jgi:hypothetical protein